MTVFEPRTSVSEATTLPTEPQPQMQLFVACRSINAAYGGIEGINEAQISSAWSDWVPKARLGTHFHFMS